MEFFTIFDIISYMAYVMSFGMFGGETVEATKQSAAAYLNGLWTALALAGVIYLVILVLGGIGLMRMAKGKQKKLAVLGFFPILNTWYAGYIAGESFLFGQKMKRAGLYAAILEGVYAVVWGLATVIEFLTYLFPNVDGTGVSANTGVFPRQMRWLFGLEAGVMLEVVRWILLFIVTVFLVVNFSALFRKYFARNPMLMTLLCAVLPFRGVAIFVVRNNHPVDYREYIRQRMEAMRRQQYGPNGPYGYGPYGDGPREPEEPFSDFGGRNDGPNGNGGSQSGDNPPPGSDDPFSDF